MDDKILPSSRDAAEPRRDSWDPVNDQPADVDREPTEDTEEWEQIIWPLRPMTCTSPRLSSAMVQWDVPDPATEMSFFVTDADMDDEVSGGSSSPELPQDQEESEEDWRIDLQLLNSVLQRTGSDSEPCDAADAQQSTAQEKEHSPHELLPGDNDVLGRESDVKEEPSTASGPVETADFADILEQSEGSEDGSFVDLKLEEEQQEPCTLLTGQGDFEEEPSSSGTEEEGDEEEEAIVPELTHAEERESEFSSCVNQGEVSAVAEQTDAAAVLITENRESQCPEGEEDLEILQQSHEDPTGLSEEPETWNDMDQDVDQCEAAKEKGELVVVTEHDEGVEDSREEERGLEGNTCDPLEERGLEDNKCDPLEERGLEDNKCDPLEERGLEGNTCDPLEERGLEGDTCDPLEERGLEDNTCDPLEERGLEDNTCDLLEERGLEGNTCDLLEERGLEGNKCDPLEERDLEDNTCDPLEERGLEGNTCDLLEERGLEGNKCDPLEERGLEGNTCDPLEERGLEGNKCDPLEERGLEGNTCDPLEERGLEGNTCDPLEERGLEGNTCDPQTPESPEHFDEIHMTDRPMQEKEPLSAAVEPPQHLKQSAEIVNLAAEAARPEDADLAVEAEQQTEPSEQKEQTSRSSLATLPEQLVQPRETDEPEITEQLPAESEATPETAEEEFSQDKRTATSHQVEGVSEGGSADTVLANEEQAKPAETPVPHANGREVDSAMARRLAERLFNLDGFQRVDVVKHLDKDNDFSRAVGEEYLKFFDFTGQTLDGALRSFLKVVVLIGETQERERVLQHFACRFHQCNPDSYSSSGAVLALTCALMLLNTDLHGQNVGKSMSSSKFVSNLDGMNEGTNFSKDLLKSLYNSIKSEPLEWAVDKGELMLVDEDAGSDAPRRSMANPFLDVPHDKKASKIKEGLLHRKLHADVDGKRIPWGKRGWRTFHGVVKGMVLYLQKVDYRRDQPVNEEVVSVHHSLAEPASDYTKKPHVFRLQTADWRVFLFQAVSKVEMNSWISRINLVSALQSSPPFPAAVGSQRRFFRPILPSLQSAHTLDRQLQSHSGMLESFRADISYMEKNLPERKKAKAKELEEHRIRAEYLHYEIRRYEIYIQVLEAWKSVKKADVAEDALSVTNLSLFDKAACADAAGEEDEEEGLTKSHSSPALPELPPQTVIKVKRNISERRTYRRVIIPRLNQEA
ncbi:PH and SEC7 domain-containing protein 2 isoform X2 [Takifugu rubripes]|uniref:PH and SEC7 domain-containing protein 2-like n=1 Tax=Takifugu rubripes TaxID=31033 RepID=H2VF20_TAKRU|nr:PH and SEC7 domain-containing protein 2-like isoform X2 [Takifugu rubripes]